MEAQSLVPGMLLDVGWQSDTGAQTWVGRVKSVDRTRIVGEPIAKPLILPAPGTFVRLATAIGSFPTTVSTVIGNDVVFERPGNVSFSNRRSGLRVRANGHARWWPEGSPDLAQAVMVTDLSIQGAGLVGEKLVDYVPGRRMAAEMDGLPLVVEVRAVLPHDHPRLAHYGVRFVTVPPELRRRINDYVSRARQDPGNWA